MVFIETTTFTKLVHEYLSDEEFAGLQHYLLNRPNVGAVIPGSGGVRKLRWSLEGKGKRGGLRVIYYWRVSEDEIWLITLYAKNEASTISPQILKKIAEEIKHG
jgi:mRNA-degrading endonuclease RelE of RelBE toxin-antitoxin system